MTHLQKITAAAKKIRKQHPNKKWTDCIKQASAGMKKATVSGAKKTAAKKKKIVPVKTYKRKANTVPAHSRSIGKIGNIQLPDIGTELLALEFKTNSLKASLRQGKKASEKKEIRQQILVLNKQFKALKAYLNTRAKFK